MKSEAAFHCKCWACYVLSLFSPFPENTTIGLFLLPVILRSVCSDSSGCNYYSFVCVSVLKLRRRRGEGVYSLSSKIFSGPNNFR